MIQIWMLDNRIPSRIPGFCFKNLAAISFCHHFPVKVFHDPIKQNHLVVVGWIMREILKIYLCTHKKGVFGGWNLEAFRNPKFSGSSPLKKIVAECCQGSRWAWSYRVLQFLVWVRRPKSFSSFFWAEIGGTFLVPWLPHQQEEIFKHGCLTEFPMGIFEVFFTRLVDIHNWSRYRSTLVVVSTVGPVLMR